MSISNITKFLASKLQPAVATDSDISEIAALTTVRLKEVPSYELENLAHTFSRRTDEEIKQYLKIMTQIAPEFKDIDIDAVLPTFKQLLLDPEQSKTFLMEEAQNSDQNATESSLCSRFINNPHAAIMIMRNENGKIVAMESINQLQLTHDFHITMENFDAIDLKHGLLHMLYVLPEYREQGIGTALKKAIINYGREHLGYQYFWAATDLENSSHRINQRLGYQPLTAETRFPDSSAFTPEVIQQLLDEYNVGSRQLTWLDSRTIQ